MQKLKILSISTMFPNPSQPLSGVFVQNRLAALAKRCELVVISPIPWFPWLEKLIPRYKERQGIPKSLHADHYRVLYPRFLSIPKFLKPMDGFFLLLRMWILLTKIKRRGFDFDLIDAHLAFPEGFAAAFLRKIFQKPVTVTLRGHDINELPDYPVRGRQVRFALQNVDQIFSVAAALAKGAVQLGADPEKCIVSSNGVDTQKFQPLEQAEARKRLNIPQEINMVLSIGYLVPRKGFDVLIHALTQMKNQKSNTMLYIVGGRGGENYVKPRLDELIERHGLQGRIIFAGARPNQELLYWYNACDVFSLMSSKEGWPNVILEAMACGKPVVANGAWGIPEIVNSPDLGEIIVPPPDPGVVAQKLEYALNKKWDSGLIRDYAEQQTWDKVAGKLESQFRRLTGKTTKDVENVL